MTNLDMAGMSGFPTRGNNIEFFFSELKGVDIEGCGYMVELMRAASNILDIHKISLAVMQFAGANEDEPEYWLAHDSLLTMLFTLSAAQLREALKIFWEFSATSYYKTLRSNLSKNESLDHLEKHNNDWHAQKGLIYQTLKPVRDVTYHYDQVEASKWVQRMKENEKERKPAFQTVDIENAHYGPGIDYNASIFHQNLFFGKARPIMKPLQEIWETQSHFLGAVQALVSTMLALEGIEKRQQGWFMKYFHGYRKDV